MSTKRIKTTEQITKRKSKTAPKLPEISTRTVMLAKLISQREQLKTQDELTLAKLITDEKIDVEKRFNRKYNESIARELKWTLSRFEKALARMTAKIKSYESTMKQILDKETEEETKDEHAKENN